MWTMRNGREKRKHRSLEIEPVIHCQTDAHALFGSFSFCGLPTLSIPALTKRLDREVRGKQNIVAVEVF
jgi:hypothetical protein